MKLIGLGVIVAVIGFSVPTELRTAYGQTDGALQYPPLSVGQDADPHRRPEWHRRLCRPAGSN